MYKILEAINELYKIEERKDKNPYEKYGEA